MSRFVPQSAHPLEPRAVPSAYVVREDAGSDATAIADTIDLFRSDLGTARREIDWDVTPTSVRSPRPLPGDYFNTTDPRGVVLRSTGGGFSVADGGPTFSGGELLSPVG